MTEKNWRDTHTKLPVCPAFLCGCHANSSVHWITHPTLIGSTTTRTTSHLSPLDGLNPAASPSVGRERCGGMFGGSGSGRLDASSPLDARLAEQPAEVGARRRIE